MIRLELNNILIDSFSISSASCFRLLMIKSGYTIGFQLKIQITSHDLKILSAWSTLVLNRISPKFSFVDHMNSLQISKESLIQHLMASNLNMLSYIQMTHKIDLNLTIGISPLHSTGTVSSKAFGLTKIQQC